MTNDQALELIRSSGNRACTVVWSVDRNEIVAVREADWMGGEEGEGTFEGRYVEVATVSLETLRAQQEECRLNELRAVERGRTRQAWQAAPIEGLLDLLEVETLSQDFRNDAVPFILKTLYYARRSTLSPSHIERLNAIARRRFFSPLGSRNAYTLECYLTVIENNPSRFFRYWDGVRPNEFPADAVMTAAGDLQIGREDVLKYLVGRVAQGGVFQFQSQFDAMLALGKIGPRAGEAAASTVEQQIYDSSDLVASARRLAIARIRSIRDDWRRCDVCVGGKVLDTAQRVPWFALCLQCFGLAHVPMTDIPH